MKVTRHGITSLIAIITLLIVSAMYHSLQTGRDMASRYAPLIDAAMEIKLEATTAHLWFEEIISGDRTVDIEAVWSHLDQSEWYAQAMLSGGENKEGTFVALDNPDLRDQIEKAIDGLHAFRLIAHQRWENRKQSGIGSDIDQQFDAVFLSFNLAADNVETTLQKVIKEQLQSFKALQNFLILITIALGIFIGYLFLRYDYIRTKDIQVLHDKEKNLRVTLSSIGDAVIITDTNGDITYMNPVATELTGWALDDAKGAPLHQVFNILNANTRLPVENPVNRVLKTGLIVGLANHTVLIAKDGSEHQIADSGAPIRSPKDDVTGVILIFRDITEEYEINEALKSSKILVSTLLNSSPDLIWLKDLKGVYIACNTKLELLFGVKQSEIIGKMDYDFVDKELADSFRKYDDAALKSGKPTMNEEWITYASDGHSELVETLKISMSDSSGRLIGILGVARDITLRKQTEVQLQKSLARLNFALSTANQGWFELNIQTGEVTVSDEHAKILGFEPKNFRPNYQRWKESIHPDDIGQVLNSFEECLKDGEVKEAEYRLRSRSGLWLWIHSIGNVTDWDDNNKPLTMIGIHRDISREKKAEESLKQSEERLRLSQSYGGIGTWEADLLHHTQIWSEVVSQQLGFPKLKEPTWNDFLNIIYPDDRNLVIEATRLHIEMGKIYDVNFRIIDTNGNIRWMRSIGKASFAADGSPTKMIGTVQEITIQKAATEKLQLSARVFSDTHEGIIITNADHCIVEVNPAFCEITGYSREEVIGKDPSFLSSGRQGPDFYQDMWQHIKKDGHWQGEIWNRKKSGEFCAELLTISALSDEAGNIINYVGVFSDITKSKQQQEKLNLMAHYDVLTKLPNRALFVDRFNQAVAHSQRTENKLAICFLDLDHFKLVNDTYGHEVGDQILISVAERIKSNIRNEDTVSRQGGDEFALLLGEVNSFAQCEHLLNRLLAAIAEPYTINNVAHNISASIGATLYPLDNSNLDTLLRHADQAMYKAKKRGRNRYCLFSVEKDQQDNYKYLRLAAIENALDNNEFKLYYQPKTNMDTGDIFGVEALIRWNHPEKGLVPPLDFLPILAGTKLEIKIGRWVIEQALAQLEQWTAQGLTLEVSVNIASYHLHSSSFIEELEAALARHPDIEPQHLQLEILESSALTDISAIASLIKTCQEDIGVSVALDDFGTGYSSLTHLRHLPAKVIKIDQSFVRDILDDPNDYAIIDGVLGLAAAFGRDVIAEGVETTQHGLMLLTMGCNKAQGYGIAKPMTANDFTKWLSNYKPNQEWINWASKTRSDEANKIMLFRLASQKWLTKFKTAIQASKDDPEQIPTINLMQCQGGAWLTRAKQEQLFETKWIDKLDKEHDKMHFIADGILNKYNNDDIESARKDLAKLQSAFDEMSNTLSKFMSNR